MLKLRDLELFTVSNGQKEKTIEALIESSSPTRSFFLLLIVSIIIVTSGIIINNQAVVIGGMLVSPLLSPVLAVGMGIVMGDQKMIWRSLRVLFKAGLYVVVISLIISWAVSEKDINPEILSRTEPSLIYFYVAVASGVAAAYAAVKEEFSERIVGVAVAIAVLPPLAVTGIGISFWSGDIVISSLGLFLANLVGIILACLVVFSLFRFYPLKHEAEKQLKVEEGLQKIEKQNNNHQG